MGGEPQLKMVLLLALKKLEQYREINYLMDTIQRVCGVNSRKIRVLGGDISQAHEFPWLVGLYKGGEFYCGATLITKKHVLTAAHCVKGFDMHSIRVVLADHDRESPDRLSTIQVRNLVDMIPHKRFDSKTFNNDIALLELDQPVDFDDRIQPLCLPQTAYKDYTGVQAVVAGWGKVGEKLDTSRILRKVVVPVWSKEDCYSSQYGKAKLSENMFCAGYTEGQRDACQGDSGGPLHMKATQGYMELIGVVSWGRGCGRPNLPGVYTKITNYLDWIEGNLNGECLCSPPA
ncbi:tryptase-related [Holotrichia oblita]|uniref:Tryptase-related n=1 Tax=Holotrichia oblita TaxID=644536 RepID=A0ACB9SU74_HOLOL|nr:tryptase-related [Holotrichia oblita]